MSACPRTALFIILLGSLAASMSRSSTESDTSYYSARSSFSDDFEDPQEAVRRCEALKDFYLEIRKKMYSPSLNPWKFVVGCFQKTPEFGWIADTKAKELTLRLFGQFGVDLADLSSDLVDKEVALGHAIGRLYSTSDGCTKSSTVSLVLYRLAENCLLSHPLELVEAFLSELDPAFRLEFVLFNLSSFIDCDKKVLSAIIAQHSADESALLHEFLDAYGLIVDGSRLADAKEKKTFATRLAVSLTKTVSAYALLFGIYYASTLVETSPNTRWALDNVVLYALNGQLLTLSQEFRDPKQTSLFHKIQMRLNSLGKVAFQLDTQDLGRVGDQMARKAQAAHDCPECQMKQLLRKEGPKGVRDAHFLLV